MLPDADAANDWTAALWIVVRFFPFHIANVARGHCQPTIAIKAIA